LTEQIGSRSVFLEPSVDPTLYPGAFTELLGQSLSHEERIASLTVLPTVQEMEESTKIGHEMVAEVMEKARHVVSFAVTPTAQRPRLTSVVSKVLALEGAVNLEDKFEVGIKSGDEGDFNLETLKAPMGEEWTKVEANTSTFTPSVLQWNSIVQQMFVLTAKVEKACKAAGCGVSGCF
jgi:hypothetical protein